MLKLCSTFYMSLRQCQKTTKMPVLRNQKKDVEFIPLHGLFAVGYLILPALSKYPFEVINISLKI